MNISEHIGFFEQEMKRRNFGIQTIENYSSCLKKFFGQSTKDHPKNINETDIRNFLASFDTPNTQRAYHSAIKKFYEICLGQKEKFKYIPYCRKNKKLPIVLSQEEIQRMFDACEQKSSLEKWANILQNKKYLYQVSSLGRIRTVSSFKIRIKQQRVGNHGYPIISIRAAKNVVKRYLVHRLVAEAFIPNADLKRTVNHIDGNKENNNLVNLEWATDYEQAIHRHYVLKKQTTNIATKIGRIKQQIPVMQYSLVGEFIKRFDSLKDAAKSVGKTHQRISLSCANDTTAYGYKWKYVSKIPSPLEGIRI